ncbi:MAG: DUF3881 family protein [Lachnospiraceae bacterium]|nr:DUF3881 family protein [Lachnospiraceae bacterium]
MLREFSAIGLSRYSGQRAAGELISRAMTDGSLRGRQYVQAGQHRMELAFNMGPFQLILRGVRKSQAELVIELAIPSLKEKRGYLLHEPELFLGERDLLYLEGTEHETYETMTVCLTEVARAYSDPDSVKAEALMVSCYGLSTEGKIILGIERTEEDMDAIRKETRRRREMLKAAREDNWNFSSRESFRQDEFANEDEILERLKQEDVFSIYDGFYYPAEKDENCFTILGDIRHIDKLLNPMTEEWVYYLELDVLGQIQRVLIHPKDLVGQPAPGRRFQGKVRFYGRMDPARLLLEDQTGFY